MSMSKGIYVHEELAHYAVYTFTLCFVCDSFWFGSRDEVRVQYIQLIRQKSDEQ